MKCKVKDESNGEFYRIEIGLSFTPESQRIEESARPPAASLRSSHLIGCSRLQCLPYLMSSILFHMCDNFCLSPHRLQTAPEEYVYQMHKIIICVTPTAQFSRVHGSEPCEITQYFPFTSFLSRQWTAVSLVRLQPATSPNIIYT